MQYGLFGYDLCRKSFLTLLRINGKRVAQSITEITFSKFCFNGVSFSQAQFENERKPLKNISYYM